MLFLASTFSSAALQLPARSAVATHSRAAASMIAPEMTGVETKKAVTGPTFSKSLATPDPIPEEGQKRALELMKSGALFRYTPGVESETALAAAVLIKGVCRRRPEHPSARPASLRARARLLTPESSLDRPG